MSRCVAIFLLAVLAAFFVPPARAEILWSDPASRVIHSAPDGTDILGGKVKRDDKSSDVLYFKFHVDPLSDAANEPYFALFQLVETNAFRLGVGNALEAWGYSAAYAAETGPSNKAAIDACEFNLHSAHPEAGPFGEQLPYELPNHNHEKTIVFRVQYVPGGDDMITVWLDPDLSHGATADNQPENITTKFKANASFDQIRLRHNRGDKGDGGNGWIFSDMAIATSFDDFVVVHFWQRWWFNALVALFFFAAVVSTVRVVEKRKFQFQLRRVEQERALEQERARIAQDLHDELGSSLTRLSLLGGLLRVDKESPALVETHAEKISQAADQTVRALEEIVWAVRPGSDTLQSLVEYLAHFANELFADSPVRCRLDLPQDLLARALPPDVRHNIFLIAKEALTNALRHSGGQVVFVQVQADGKKFKLVIADDGKGFDANAPTAGGEHNGLENMKRRAESVSGQLLVTSGQGQGARVVFEMIFPIDQKS
jgi:signal transduction histidine kinase